METVCSVSCCDVHVLVYRLPIRDGNTCRECIDDEECPVYRLPIDEDAKEE